MIYADEFDKTKPSPTSIFPPIPEQSLYFYPRDLLTYNTFNNTKITQAASIIVGPKLSSVNLSLGYNHVVIRVGFHPGGLHRLTHLPMHELLGQTFNSEDLFSNDIREVNDQLRNSGSYDEMKEIVVSFLLRKLNKVKQMENFDFAMLKLMKGGGNLTVDYLAKEAYLSFRQFERKCRDRIGIPPKLFSKVIRFSKAYRMREANPKLSWTSIVNLSGYFDHAHLIRDFKEFYGNTPSTLYQNLLETNLRLQSVLRM